MGWASRPSFVFHALTGETPIPLFGNTPKFLAAFRVELRNAARGSVAHTLRSGGGTNPPNSRSISAAKAIVV